MKTAVSLPDDLFRRAERFTARLGISRSRLYALALVEYLEAHADERVTDALNDLYPAEPSAVDTELATAQATVIDEDW